MMVRLWRTVLVIGIIGSALPAGARGQEAKPDASAAKADESPKSEKAARPETHKVERGPFKVETELKGDFEAATLHEVALAPEAWSALVVERAVDHGQRVAKGDQLVWLDMEKIDQQIEDARHARELELLALQINEAELKSLEESLPLDLESAERAHQIAADELEYFRKVDRDSRVRSAQFSLDSSEHSLEYAMEELKQLEKMYKADDLTEETEEIILKRARHDVEFAQFALEQSRTRTERTLNSTIPRQLDQLVESARRAELNWEKTRVTLPPQLTRKRLEREKLLRESERSEVKLNELLADRERMIVRAPADGIVYYGQCTRGKWADTSMFSRQLRAGGNLAPHQVFLTVVETGDLRIRASVPEKELGAVREGLKGFATATGFPDQKRPVELKRILAIPVAPGTFDAELAVDLPADSRLVPGMTCDLTLVSYETDSAVVVPASAVFDDEAGDGKHVFVATESGHERRAVQVGHKTDKQVEITGGLAEGDEVLTKKPSDSK